MNLTKFYEIIRTTQWSVSHGAVLHCENSVITKFAGLAPLYFSLIYTMRSKRCVCLGSGAGFVPKIMTYAQNVLIEEKLISDYDVSLVDADLPGWGDRIYADHIEGYPEIKLINKTTDEAADLFNDISYLHVDADHSEQQVYKDLCNYGSRMKQKNWIITCHDTHSPLETTHGIGVYNSVKRWAQENNHDLVNFPIGFGTALIMPRIDGRSNEYFNSYIVPEI